ncbi:MAG: RecX family transcriptional regulator [Clostridiales bacterium]|nr:RecX family transcriptional regulator [Clostridiales bacterium]
MFIREIKQLKKGRLLIRTDELSFPVYEKEAAAWQLSEGSELDEDTWERLCREVLNKRVIRRAMYILQQMDRTEMQLRRKLKDSNYPDRLVDVAIDYVKSYHYIDDYRYAATYIRFHQEEKSRMQLAIALQQRGVAAELIDQALDEVWEDQEASQIKKLLIRKHYDPEHMDQKEKHRIYQYLLRRGFSNSEIKRQMDLT